MKKQYVILLLLWLVVVGWMCLIFAFSMENAMESKETSNNFLASIFDLFIDSYDSYTPEQQMAILEQYSFFIRKTAHFSIYTVLGFFLANALSYQNTLYRNLHKGRGFALALLIGVLYAISDEIHQIFVPGRAGQVCDVLVDSAGVLVGVIGSHLLIWLFRKRKKDNMTVVKCDERNV